MPSSFYSRRGDDGATGLLGQGRVPKHDPRLEACGAVDEAQACMGMVRAGGCGTLTAEIVLAVQRDLQVLMAELAAAGAPSSPLAGLMSEACVERVEQWIHEVETQVRLPREFVLPGDSSAGASLHLTRTVVRRAERRVAQLAREGLLGNPHVLGYLNRLSSLLFALALLEDQSRG